MVDGFPLRLSSVMAIIRSESLVPPRVIGFSWIRSQRRASAQLRGGSRVGWAAAV